MKILVVDDESDIGYILRFELERLGHEAIVATSATEACDYLKNETPDAILCDFQMPKMNGLELFNWLKTINKQVPFYILTGEAMMDSQSIKDAGITDILYKPQDLLKLSSIFK